MTAGPRYWNSDSAVDRSERTKKYVCMCVSLGRENGGERSLGNEEKIIHCREKVESFKKMQEIALKVGKPECGHTSY